MDIVIHQSSGSASSVEYAASTFFERLKLDFKNENTSFSERRVTEIQASH